MILLLFKDRLTRRVRFDNLHVHQLPETELEEQEKCIASCRSLHVCSRDIKSTAECSFDLFLVSKCQHWAPRRLFTSINTAGVVSVCGLSCTFERLPFQSLQRLLGPEGSVWGLHTEQPFVSRPGQNNHQSYKYTFITNEGDTLVVSGPFTLRLSHFELHNLHLCVNY